MLALDPARLITPGYWFGGNPGPPTGFSYALAILFVVLIAASTFVWLRRRELFPGKRVRTRLTAQFGPWFVGIAAAGLMFVVLRLVESPVLTARFLWFLCLAAYIGLGLYVCHYVAMRLPMEEAQAAREEEQRRFLPKRRRGRRRR